MKKSQKLLRKLLADYRERLVKMPYNERRSCIVDAITVLLESGGRNGQKRNS
jgi:hypothetical protein